MVIPALLLVLQAAQVPTFPSQVQAVGVTVTATDARTHAPVTDMKREDFLILEDGKRQEIEHFELTAVPASVVILLDTSTSMFGLLPTISDAASRLVRSLRPVDEVHVATFDSTYRILSDFTTDHESAVASLAGARQGGDTALNRAVYTATRLLERRHGSEVQRRRILILLSDGEDTSSALPYEAVEEALRRSRVACYVVHLPRAPGVDSGIQQIAERALFFVKSLVYETGGQLVTVPFPYDGNIIHRAFSGIAAELGSQYFLSYASSADPTKGGWRKVQVALRSRSGVNVRFRRGYYVPPR